MGGDNAPGEIVSGCIDAVIEKPGFTITLVGDGEKIKETLAAKKYKGNRIFIHHTTEVVTNEDSPTKVIRSKKDSSMVVAFNLLKENKGDVMVSAGNSGALMAGGIFILGRIDGIDRPSLPAIIPTKNGNALIIDAGLNTVCKPINLLQFGIMGSIYMSDVLGIEKPKVGLLNVGAEEGKGNDILKQAYNLMSSAELCFVGNVEGKDITENVADVVVCDGFVGNVLLKFYEGVGTYFLSIIKKVFTANLFSKLAALALKRNLKDQLKSTDPDENGGAPLLGVKGLVIKSHGSSKAKTIKNVIIKRAYSLAQTSIIEQISNEFKNFNLEEVENDN